ncbi:MAG: neutral zinc metallopeptidase [Hyphomicrobium sp.]
MPVQGRGRYGRSIAMALAGAMVSVATMSVRADAGVSAPSQGALPASEQSVRIKGMIADAWADATATWSGVLGDRIYQSDVPQINFVSAVRASHCYGLYISPGPVYCSGNTTVFVSVANMEDLAKRIPGIGDAGLAFLVAHELGHHVQKLTGRFRVLSALARATPYHQRELALRFELEADCLAGVWASKSPKFAASEGSRAAMIASLDAIGDDRILASPGGTVDPARFTHGSSEQRVRWFKEGLDRGTVDACDVLSANIF